MYVPAFETSQGKCIVSPATNLNVSDLEMNIGSCFPELWLAAVTEIKEKKNCLKYEEKLKRKTMENQQC